MINGWQPECRPETGVYCHTVQEGRVRQSRRATEGIAAKAREHADKAVDVLVEGMDDPDGRIRIAAAKEILDRGYGKPLTMTADVTNKIEEFDDESLDAAISVLRSAINADGEVGGASATSNGKHFPPASPARRQGS